MQILVALLSGALFGTGLLASGMTDTLRVQGWLDITGDWDPTLAFVMGGAILPMALAWWIAGRHGKAMPRPEFRFDRGLVAGSVMFGMGWALVGLCPGPALASLGFGGWQGFVFFGAMLVGMWAASPVRKRAEETV